MSDQMIANLAAQSASVAIQKFMGEMGKVHTVFLEALRQAGIKKQGRLFVRPAVVTMKTALLSGTTQGSYNFRVPSEEVFLIKEMRGHLSNNNGDGEALQLGNFTAMTPEQYIVAKARNCLVTLERTDRQLAIAIESGFCLADVLPAAGGLPIRFDEMGPAWIIPPSESLKMTATLLDTALVGQSSNYGLTISGALLRIEG